MYKKILFNGNEMLFEREIFGSLLNIMKIWQTGLPDREGVKGPQRASASLAI